MAEKAKAGRPTKYTEELGIEICEKIATSSKGLHRLCKENDSFPSVPTIMRWLLDGKHQSFCNQYTRAREEQAEFMAEEMLDIADDSSRDTIHTEEGDYQNVEFINRSRLRVDTRKWLASKLKPKKYGDKVDITSDGQRLKFEVGFKKPEE